MNIINRESDIDQGIIISYILQSFTLKKYLKIVPNHIPPVQRECLTIGAGASVICIRVSPIYRYNHCTVIQCDAIRMGTVFAEMFSDSLNKTSRGEDNLLAQIYEIKYVFIIIMMILILYNIIQKCILTLQ